MNSIDSTFLDKSISLQFADRFVEEINKIKTYKVLDVETEHDVITVDCNLVCDIITVLLDEFGLNDIKEIK